MATILRFFLGANTPQGFVSRFDQLGDPRGDWRCTVIKGGPGTGKSTLMRRLSDALSDDCKVIEEIHCSSDTDSLDGVIFPEFKLSIADGTPPHALEPRYPGAYENVVSLCDCWDKNALYAARGTLIPLADRISQCHKGAVSYLYGAGALLGEVRQIAGAATDLEKIRRLAKRLAQNEIPRVSGPGSERVRLLSAVTNKGPILFADTVAAVASKLYVVDDPWGHAAPELMKELRTLALAAGQEVITCVCPMAPFSKIDHLLLPGLGLGFVTRNKFHPIDLPAYRVIHARRFTDADAIAARKMRIKFLLRASENMLEQAGERIGEAKALHDELEAIYKDAMDFRKAGEITLGVIGQFRRDAGL